MNNKSQLETMQTAFVVMLVFFILIIAFVFFIAYYRQSSVKSMSEHLQIANSEKILAIEHMPEMQCSFDNVLRDGCLDKKKIDILKAKISQEQLHYKSFFGNIKLSISEIGPDGHITDNLIYNYPKEDYSAVEKVNMPITLYEPETKSYFDGVMTIEIYS